jgi:predicted permease
MLEFLWQDIRLAARGLRRSPIFACVGIATIIVGVGANAAIFNIAHALLWRALPVPSPDRLIRYRWTADGRLPSGDVPSNITIDFTLSKPMFDALRARQRTSTDLLAWGSATRLNVRREGLTATVAQAAWVSGSAFRVLDVRPSLGRTIDERDDREGGTAGGWTANITDKYWRSAFASSQDVVGMRLLIQGVPVAIAGVLPPHFNGVLAGMQPDIVMPLAAEATIAGAASLLKNPGASWLVVMGRLRPEARLATAAAELATIRNAVVDEAVPPRLRDADFNALRLDVTSGARGWSVYQIEYRRPLLLLQALGGVVLLLVVANLSGLFLALAAARLTEFDVRGALGASQQRLFRHLLAESAILAVIATPIAVITAAWIGAAAVPFFANAGLFGDGSLDLDLKPDAAVTAAVAAAAILTTTVASLSQAAILTRRAGHPVRRDLRHESHVTRISSWLMPTQIALSFVLTVAAAACGLSRFRLMTAPTGMTMSTVVISRPDFSGRDERDEQRHALDERVIDAIRAQPGVVAAGITSEPPMENERAAGHYRAINGPAFREDASVPEVAVGPGYFDTIGVRRLWGRDFDANDRRGAPDVCAVNASAATFFFGAANAALGQRLERVSNSGSMRCTIVAVVADAKFWSAAQDPPRTVYRPSHQVPAGARAYIVRGENRAQLDRALRTVIEPLLRDAPMAPTVTMNELTLRTIALERAVGWLSACLAALALLLTCLSLFGQVTWSVTQRTREFGIRLAIGATRAGIVNLVASHLGRTVTIGVGIGLAGSWLTSNLVDAFLYKTNPVAVPLLGGATLIVVVTAILAAVGPTRRAACVDPAVILRML